MSSSAVQQVIRRAVSDPSFRQQLQSNPSSALRGFDLTADESHAISSRDPVRLAAFGVDQRVSKAFTIGDPVISDQMTDVPNSTGGVTRLEVEPGGASRVAVEDSGTAGSGATNALDSGSAAAATDQRSDEPPSSRDLGLTSQIAADNMASGAAPSWHDDAQPTIAASTVPSWRDDAQPVGADSTAPAWRDDAQSTRADSTAPAWRDDAQSTAADSIAPAWRDDAQSTAADSTVTTWRDDAQPLAADAPLSSFSAVHDVAPTDLSSDSIAGIGAGDEDALRSISVDGDAQTGDLGNSEVLHPDTPQ